MTRPNIAANVFLPENGHPLGQPIGPRPALPVSNESHRRYAGEYRLWRTLGNVADPQAPARPDDVARYVLEWYRR